MEPQEALPRSQNEQDRYAAQRRAGTRGNSGGQVPLLGKRHEHRFGATVTFKKVFPGFDSGFIGHWVAVVINFTNSSTDCCEDKQWISISMNDNAEF